MHITRVEIANVPPLGNLEFDCDERVNLFIGPNASGKSTILRAIDSTKSLRSESSEEFIVIGSRQEQTRTPMVRLWLSDDWRRRHSLGFSQYAVPSLYIPAVRVGLGGRNILDGTIDYAGGVEFEDRNLGGIDTDSGVFYGQQVESAFQQLREYFGSLRSQQHQSRKSIDIGYSCAKAICSEVIHDAAPHPFIEIDEHETSGRAVRYGMGIGTSDDFLGDPLYAGALSSGTQITLLWIWALTLTMADHYAWEDGWEKDPGILLIDEIENHLHPTWQRRVIPALLKHFPGLQIFATTHSPFVVAGLKAGQVHLLNRDSETGAVTSSTNDRDVIGWTADEILRNMMGVDEPTDQLTVDRANRLRRLREKETLSPEEESELNDLRRQVNQDFLNKAGPLEAQRERYADLMREFIASRQSELTQDGA